MKLSIITPVGGSEEEAEQTAASVRFAARENPGIAFEHILVLNNGACFADLAVDEPNLCQFVCDLNPIANRSLARNVGVTMTALDSDFVLFLDSGDMLLPEALRNLAPGAGAVHSFTSLVMTDTDRFLRSARTERLIEFINPFYIGATWVPTALARTHHFPDGRKEDWKLWVSFRRSDVHFVTYPQVNYVYTVRSRRDHARRKLRLIGDQYGFFRHFLAKSFALSIVSLAVHYGIQASWWFGALQREPDPGVVDGWLNQISTLSRRGHSVNTS